MMKDRTRERLIDLAFILAILVLSMLARIQLLPLESGDFQFCLNAWMRKIQILGPWRSLSVRISDYSSPYMYLMCLVSGIENTKLALKGISIFFDYAAAGVMLLLVKQLTGNHRKGIAAMAATLLCPTVIVNSAWWCQCDIIYITFLLLALLFLVKEKSALCCIMIGIAFSFKVQAVFILPFIVILWLKRQTIRLPHLLFIPAVFFLMMVPAWIAGRPLHSLLEVYFIQGGEFPFGTLHYPNMYEFFNENNLQWHHMKEIGDFGVFFSFGVLGLFAYWVWAKKFRMTPEIMITMALFSVCLALFTLPHMHERYGLLADILAIAYALLRPEKTPVALCYIVVSLLSYIPFLNSIDIIPGLYLSFAMLILNILLGQDLARQINSSSI